MRMCVHMFERLLACVFIKDLQQKNKEFNSLKYKPKTTYANISRINESWQ